MVCCSDHANFSTNVGPHLAEKSFLNGVMDSGSILKMLPCSCTGLDVVLSTPPANLSGVVLGSTSLLLSWSHPQESGYIQGYSVTYNNTHDSAMYLQVEGTTLTLKDLQKFTNYSIQVAAFNSGGCGPSATIYLMTDSDS